MTTTIGIVGSREWSDKAAFEKLLLWDDEIWVLVRSSDVRIVSGACRGVDEMAAWYAQKHHCALTEYAPSKSRPFTQATHERNQMIADDLMRSRDEGHEVALIAMPGPKSNGTWDTVRRAERAGIKVIVREVPE